MHNIKIQFLLTALFAVTFITSCDDSSTGTDDPEPEVETSTVEDLDTNGEDGEYTFFSLRTGEEVSAADSATTDWDIAINSSTILTNSGISGPGEGGAVLLDVPFNEVTIAPEDGYAVDADEELAIPTGTNNGWYVYTAMENPQHAILPIEDVTIILKTGDGNHYAKIEMISYYEGNPDTSTEEFANTDTRPEPGYYTFRYAIQVEEDIRELN